MFPYPFVNRPGAPPTRKRGKLAGQPGLLTIRHAHSIAPLIRRLVLLVHRHSAYTARKRQLRYGKAAHTRIT